MRVTVRRSMTGSVQAVWDVLTDLDAWPAWGPSVRGARLDDATELATGVTGTVTTAIGLPLPFTITTFRPGKEWAWRVAGVPATSHGVTTDDRGTVAWMSAPVWAPAYLPVLALALRRIDDLTRP